MEEEDELQDLKYSAYGKNIMGLVSLLNPKAPLSEIIAKQKRRSKLLMEEDMGSKISYNRTPILNLEAYFDLNRSKFRILKCAPSYFPDFEPDLSHVTSKYYNTKSDSLLEIEEIKKPPKPKRIT